MNYRRFQLLEIAPADEADGMFAFKLSSDYTPVAGYPLIIDTLSVEDATTEAPTYNPQITTNPIQFTSTSAENEVEVNVTFTKNPAYVRWDNLTVSLTDSDEYTVATNANERTVVIREEQTSDRSITLAAPISVVEGEVIAVTLITSETVPSGETISVELNVTENSGSFLDPNYTTTHHTMTSARDMEPIMIPTRKQDVSADGEIELEIVRGNNYEPGPTNDSTATIAIQEEDLLPKVTIGLPSGAPTRVDEGEDIQFVLSASAVTPAPSDPVMVNVQLVDTGDFLRGENSRVIPVTSGGTETFEVFTDADADDEDNGTITAMVIADPNQADPTKRTTYLRGATEDTSAVVMITDNDDISLPNVEISATKASIDEGEDAVFELIARNVRDQAFGVHVRFSEDRGDFLVRDLNMDSITVLQIVNPNFNSQVGPMTISLPIIESTVFDNVAEPSGIIIAQVLSDPADTDTYAVGEDFSASINVTDQGADAELAGISFGEISLNGTAPTTSNYSIVEGGLIEITIDSTTMITNSSGLDVRYSVGISGDFITLPVNTVPNFNTYYDPSPSNSNPSATIASGADESVIRIQTEDDISEEFDGSVMITLLTPEKQSDGTRPYYLVNPSDVRREIAIMDNDPLLTISNVTEGKLTIVEGTHDINPTLLNVVVAIDGSVTPVEEITVSYSTTLLTATSQEYKNATAEDFTDTSGTLTFTTTASDAKMFDVPIVADAEYESTEAFALNFEVTAGSARIEHSQVIVLITDEEDSVPPELTIRGIDSINEGTDEATAIFEIRSNKAITGEIQVGYTTRGATSQGIDFAQNPGTRTSPAIQGVTFTDPDGDGVFTGLLEIDLTIDSFELTVGRLFVQLVNDPTNSNVYTVIPNVTVFITVNDDITPVLTITAGDETVMETTGVMAVFTITSDQKPRTALPIRYTPTSTNFLASGVSGKTVVVDPPLEFQVNDDGDYVATLNIPVDVDTIIEQEGTIEVELEEDNIAPKLYTVGTPASASVNVVDPNNVGISIATKEGSIVNEGDSDNVPIMFTVSLSAAATEKVSVKWSTSVEADDNATAGADFVSVSNEPLEFDIGEMTKDIVVMVIGDEVLEETIETFTVTLSEGSLGVLITTASVKGQIMDNDAQEGVFEVSVSVSPDPVVEGNPAEFEFTVLPRLQIGGLELSISVVETGSYLAWRAPRTFTMTTNPDTLVLDTHDDVVIERPGMVTVTLNAVAGSYIVNANNGSKSVQIVSEDREGEVVVEPRISVAQVAVEHIVSNINTLLQGRSQPIQAEPAPVPIRPSVSISAVETEINEGSPAHFVLKSNNGDDSTEIAVTLQISYENALIEGPEIRYVSLSGQDSETISISTINDDFAGKDGFISVSIQASPSFEISAGKDIAVVAVSDAIDRQQRVADITAQAQSFLPDLMGIMGSSAVEIVTQRSSLEFQW